MKKTPLMVAGIIFSIVALMHLLRILYQWQIVIAGYVVPLSFSIAGLLIAIILALWMFTSAMRN